MENQTEQEAQATGAAPAAPEETEQEAQASHAAQEDNADHVQGELGPGASCDTDESSSGEVGAPPVRVKDARDDPLYALATENRAPLLPEEIEARKRGEQERMVASGRKLDVLKELMQELKEPLWRECERRNPKLREEYFAKKYSIFKEECKTLYERCLDGSFETWPSFGKMMSEAEKLYGGQASKAEVDAEFTWWAAEKRGIARGTRRGRPGRPGRGGRGRGREVRANLPGNAKWLLD